MKQTDAIARLQRQIDSLRGLASLDATDAAFKKWQRDTELTIEHIFGPDTRHLKDFEDVSFIPGSWDGYDPDPEWQRAFQEGRHVAEAILQSMIEELQEYPPKEQKKTEEEFAVDRIERICRRFHLVARQLRQRYDSRPTLEVEDEYDVQDLLHALLKVEFDDVRPEEWTPSYAGKASRMDFLLKREQIVVETKKTRKGLGEKEVGDELMIDISRYKSHPDCRLLFCFVYDPEGRIANPTGIEKDLSSEHSGVKVRVMVAPKGL